MFYWPWSPSIPAGRHDQAAIPEIYARSFPSLPRQLRLKFRIMKSLSTAKRMCDKSSLMTSNTVFPKPLAERKVISLIEVSMEASQVLTQGSLNTIPIERFIFVASITTRSLLFLLSLLERWHDLNGGGVILIMHQYAYHPQQGSSIHSSCQLEYFANDVNNKPICIPGGLQHIQTVDGYVFPLSIRNGLPYLGMRPYTDDEYESLSHVILTSDVDWDPRVLDFDIDDKDAWYDAVSDNVNHCELFDAFGNYKGRTTELEVSSADTCLVRYCYSGLVRQGYIGGSHYCLFRTCILCTSF
jgi:hypothetical protein